MLFRIDFQKISCFNLLMFQSTESRISIHRLRQLGIFTWLIYGGRWPGYCLNRGNVCQRPEHWLDRAKPTSGVEDISLIPTLTRQRARIWTLIRFLVPRATDSIQGVFDHAESLAKILCSQLHEEVDAWVQTEKAAVFYLHWVDNRG